MQWRHMLYEFLSVSNCARAKLLAYQCPISNSVSPLVDCHSFQATMTFDQTDNIIQALPTSQPFDPLDPLEPGLRNVSDQPAPPRVLLGQSDVHGFRLDHFRLPPCGFRPALQVGGHLSLHIVGGQIEDVHRLVPQLRSQARVLQEKNDMVM